MKKNYLKASKGGRNQKNEVQMDKELSANAECLNPSKMAQEMTNKIRPSDEKRTTYLRQEHEVTGEETLRVAECSNSFSVAYEVAEKELPPRASREALSSTSRPTEVSDCDFDAEIQAQPKNTMPKNSSDIHFKCSNCQTPFKHKENLSKHVKTQACAYRCKVCNKRCRSTNELKVHLTKHSVETLLSMQTMNHHENDPIRCILCNHICKCRNDLKKHLIKHSKDPHNECEICKKVFKHKWNLTRHKNIHYEKSPFTCEICSRSCQSKACLKNHMTKHSDEKSHNCSICPKSYKLKGDLSRHMKRTHNQ